MNILKKLWVVGAVWGLIAGYIVLIRLGDCFSLGYAPDWCQSFLTTLFLLTIGLPAMIGWWFSVGFGLVGFVLLPVATILSAIALTFVLASAWKVFLRYVRRTFTN